MSKTMSALEKFMPTRQGEKNGNLTILNTMIAEVKEAENSRDSQKLQILVNRHFEAIKAMLDRQQEKIDNAKRLANRAKDIAEKNTFWNSIKQKTTFGLAGIDIDEERAKATADGLVATNEAVAEMNQAIQGIVALTCCSVAYSKIMIDTMGGILTEGFIDAAGQRQQLTENQKELVERLLFTAKQHIAKESKDLEQDEKISQIFEILKNKDEIDSRQEEQIRKNAELIAQNQQNILVLQKRNNKIMAIFAWVAIVLSLLSLAISASSKFKLLFIYATNRGFCNLVRFLCVFCKIGTASFGILPLDDY